MRKLLHLGFLLALLLVPLTSLAQGSNGGILYASDFAQWNLPQGTGPAMGSISYPDASICRVSSQGYNFVGPKVGRPLLIVDVTPSLSETVIPTQVIVGPGGCTINATMTHQHFTYTVRSGTAGLQEAIDYYSGQWFGALVIFTRQWTQIGGVNSMLSGLSGNSLIWLVDERTNCPVPYTWSGSAYAAAPSWCSGGGGGLNSFTTGPLAPLFTSSLGSDPLLNPVLTFTLDTTPDATFLANFSGSTAPWDQWTLLAGANVTLTPNTGAKTLTLSAAASTGITDIIAGTGLNGGGTTPTVTINLDNALPNGETATTQAPGDTTLRVATDAFVTNAIPVLASGCEDGFRAGLSPIPAGTYPPQIGCKNTLGYTVTITSISCYADTGTTTLNVADSLGNPLLTGPITCSNTFAAGTQSATVTLAAGNWMAFSYVADGNATQTTWSIGWHK